MARILTVDDEPLIRKQIARVLQRQGHDVHQAGTGVEALHLASTLNFDLALIDYNLPKTDGLVVLQKLRDVQPGCLRILITGMLNLPLAVEAVNRGEVTRVVEKPFKNERLLAAVDAALNARQRMVEVARVQQEASRDEERKILEDCLNQGCVHLALQPLVNGKTGKVEAFEALLRSQHSILNGPLSVLRAVEKHEQLSRLSEIVFQRASEWLDKVEGDFRLFINIHPEELADFDGMCTRLEMLRPWAHRIVLEITERSRLQAIDSWEKTMSRVTEMGFLVAVDDLGAGYSSLSVLADLQPKYIKVDMSIIRNVHLEPRKRRLVELLCKFAEATDAMIVAEGVEYEEELHTLKECGAHLLQGYFFAKPSLEETDVRSVLGNTWDLS
jgi:EAL domain-containing protein (putative c-di-GMP-specific phosphodiesterase class I)/CheY-like chemotaxis protein